MAAPSPSRKAWFATSREGTSSPPRRTLTDMEGGFKGTGTRTKTKKGNPMGVQEAGRTNSLASGKAVRELDRSTRDTSC